MGAYYSSMATWLAQVRLLLRFGFHTLLVYPTELQRKRVLTCLQL